MSQNPTTADDLAWEDARLFGSGFVMIFPDGRRERIPPEAVSLDRGELLKARTASTTVEDDQYDTRLSNDNLKPAVTISFDDLCAGMGLSEDAMIERIGDVLLKREITADE